MNRLLYMSLSLFLGIGAFSPQVGYASSPPPTSKSKKTVQKSSSREIAPQKKASGSREKKTIVQKSSSTNDSRKTSRVLSKEPKLLGSYHDWNAYESLENGKKVCYMTSFPKKKETLSQRKLVYMLIAHRPHLNSRDVVSFDAGCTLKKKSHMTVTIEGNVASTFKLFTEKDTAWCVDAPTDKKLTLALLKGSRLLSSSESDKSEKIQDVYSLNGANAAYTHICKACGLERG